MKHALKSKGVSDVRSALLGHHRAQTTASATSPKVNLLTKMQALWWVVFPMLLGAVATWVAISSHVPNSWLTGWDTLHPEFNFGLNLQRVLWGVFRPDQGLGSVATHAHVVELPRILILWLMSLVVPLNLLRYSYVAICLILGPIGIFVFTRYLLRKSTYNELTASSAAFGAGLWYLFNLGTLQHFALPFEMFPTNYAANGWLFWLLWKYLEKGKKQDLLWLILVNFLASNMAYSFISWYVYFGGVLLVVVSSWLIRWWQNKEFAKNEFAPWRNLIAIVAILIANLYWLGPNLYFVATHSWHVPLAKNNRFVSEEIFFHNKEFGTVIDTITMKNHLFNWMIRDQGNFTLIFEEYRTYLTGVVGWIPVLLFGVILVGTVGVVKKIAPSYPNKKRLIWLLPMTLPLAASVVAFLSLNPPLSFIFDILRENISIAKEGLRNPFIKFNLLLMVSYATFFAIGLALIIERLQKWLGQKMAAFTMVTGVLICTLVLGWPFIEGKLIDKRVQLAIPSEYFEMFDWFNQQPSQQRVLVLPAPHFWAWDYHDWGYQGAGFMWFGIKQPFFSRDSDRWNPHNEEAYRELNTAIVANDWQHFYALLEKYNVGYIIFDTTVSTNGEQPSVLFKEVTERFLKDSSLFTKNEFSDKLAVYRTTALADKPDGELTTISQPAVVSPTYFWQYHDLAFEQLGNYISSPLNELSPSTYYPARNLLLENDQLNDSLFKVENNQLKVTTNNTQDFTYSLVEQDSITFNVVLRNNPDETFIILNPILPFTEGSQDTFSTALPITIPSTHRGLFYLTLNGHVFKASNEIQNDQLLGTTKLPLSSQNTLNLYFDLTEEFVDNLPDQETALSFNCSLVNSTSNISVQYPKNGVVLEADPSSSACVQYQFVPAELNPDFTKTNLSQIKLSFSALDPTSTNAELCIFDTGTNSCLNKQTIFSISPNQEVSTATVLTELSTIDPTKTQLLLVLNNDQSTKKAELTFRTLAVNYSLPDSSQTFEVRLPDDYQNPILKASNVISFPLNEKTNIVELSQLKRDVDSCGSTTKARVKREIQDSDSERFVRYSAQYGQSCDKVAFDELPHNQGYLVAVTSRNVSGISSRLCLKNATTGKCDLYMPLGNQKEFKREVFVVPPTDGSIGYSAHFTTFAPGDFASVNDIKSIEVLPIPFTLLQSLRTVSTEKLADDQVIITNHQSYEKNFVAFWYKPPFSIIKIDSQILLNNWANGWQLAKDDVQDKQANGYTLQTFFWPNLLIGLGLLPLVGVTLWLLVLSRRK